MPRALDLFCGGGGAARGLIAAGFDVVGIDIKNHRKSYPGLFIQGDALRPPVRLEDFDFVWASPPCQHASAGTPTRRRSAHADLIPATRELLSGHPLTAIENVPLARIRRDVKLNGPMFGLCDIERERHFEVSWMIWNPPPLKRLKRTRPPLPVRRNPAYSSETLKQWRAKGYVFPKQRANKGECARAMGLPASMTMYEIGEAIPPAYAEFIGRAAMDALPKPIVAQPGVMR